jgi:hypothetical protein
MRLPAEIGCRDRGSNKLLLILASSVILRSSPAGLTVSRLWEWCREGNTYMMDVYVILKGNGLLHSFAYYHASAGRALIC